jgi:hypothetical protein
MSIWGRKMWGSLGSAVVLAITLSACGTAPGPSVERKSDPAADVSGIVLSYQRQIRERDKRIEELESQLNALKLIEEDVEKRRKPLRSPAMLTPFEKPSF